MVVKQKVSTTRVSNWEGGGRHFVKSRPWGKPLLNLLMRERTDLESWSPMKGILIKTGLGSGQKTGEASTVVATGLASPEFRKTAWCSFYSNI